MTQHSFDEEIKRYVAHLESLEETFPLIMYILGSIQKKAGKDMEEFLADKEKEIDDDGDEAFVIPSDSHFKFRKLKKREDTMGLAGVVIPRSLLVSMVSQYDAYLGRLIRTLYFVKPEILNASQKNITLSDLLSYDSIESVREYMIEKEVESVLRDSHSDHFEWLEKKLEMPLRKGLSAWPTFIEITERRNLYVHCDGVISSQYLNVCKKNQVKGCETLKLGEVLNINYKYFRLALNCLLEIGIKLGQVLWRKLQPEKADEADQSLNDIVFQLIQKNNYDLAINILQFAVSTFKKTTVDQFKYYFIINLAQSYKWKGDEKNCSELMKSIDWSPLSYLFRLSNAVLEENYDEAALFMKRIGNNEEEITKYDYQEWPLFKKFRESDNFQNAYREIYKESFEVIQTTNESNQGIKKKLLNSTPI